MNIFFRFDVFFFLKIICVMFLVVLRVEVFNIISWFDWFDVILFDGFYLIDLRLIYLYIDIK